MKSTKCARILPRNEHTLKTVIIDPITEARYTRTEVGFLAIPELDDLFHAPDFDPPARWQDFDPRSPYWDEHFLKVFAPEYIATRDSPQRFTEPINPYIQTMLMGKSYARKMLEGKPEMCGIITWGEWSTIKPCWLIVNRIEALWLRSEEELGLQH